MQGNDVLVEGWPTSTHRRATYFVKNLREGRNCVCVRMRACVYIYTHKEMCVCIYIYIHTHTHKGEGEDWIHQNTVIYKQQATIKVRLNDKVGKTKRLIGLLCCIKSDELYFPNILSDNKVVTLLVRSANLLHYVCYTVLMKPFRWPRAANTFLEGCMQPATECWPACAGRWSEIMRIY